MVIIFKNNKKMEKLTKKTAIEFVEKMIPKIKYNNIYIRPDIIKVDGIESLPKLEMYKSIDKFFIHISIVKIEIDECDFEILYDKFINRFYILESKKEDEVYDFIK